MALDLHMAAMVTRSVRTQREHWLMFDQTKRCYFRQIDLTGGGASPWRVTGHVSQRPSKINHARTTSPFAPCAVVMQDKATPDFVACICTDLIIPPAMRTRSMYSVYILFRQYME